MKRSNSHLSALAAAAIATIVAASAPANAQTAPTFHHDYESAAADAKAQDKPLIVIFSAVWCGPCQQMKQSVYPSPEVTAYHDDFIWAYLDADDPANQAIKAQNRVSGIPHIAFEDSAGEPIGKLIGGVAPAYFADVLLEMKEKSSGVEVGPREAAPRRAPEKRKKSFWPWSRRGPGV